MSNTPISFNNLILSFLGINVIFNLLISQLNIWSYNDLANESIVYLTLAGVKGDLVTSLLTFNSFTVKLSSNYV